MSVPHVSWLLENQLARWFSATWSPTMPSLAKRHLVLAPSSFYHVPLDSWILVGTKKCPVWYRVGNGKKSTFLHRNHAQESTSKDAVGFWGSCPPKQFPSITLPATQVLYQQPSHYSMKRYLGINQFHHLIA